LSPVLRNHVSGFLFPDASEETVWPPGQFLFLPTLCLTEVVELASDEIVWPPVLLPTSNCVHSVTSLARVRSCSLALQLVVATLTGVDHVVHT
jgi:hypothetical protein